MQVSDKVFVVSGGGNGIGREVLELLQRGARVAAIAVSQAGLGQSAYGASKAAVKLFTEGLIAELRGSTVVPAVVFPGAVGTNMPANSGVDIPTPQGQPGKAPRPPRRPMLGGRSSTSSRRAPNGGASAATRACSTGSRA